MVPTSRAPSADRQVSLMRPPLLLPSLTQPFHLSTRTVLRYLIVQRKLKEKNLHGLLKPKTRAEDATCEATSLASRNPRMLQGEDKQCLICFEAPARALLAPCGHCDLCRDCCAKLRAREGYAKCPTCRVPIERVLQMDTD
jgi:hypothetical protein